MEAHNKENDVDSIWNSSSKIFLCGHFWCLFSALAFCYAWNIVEGVHNNDVKSMSKKEYVNGR